MNFVYGFDIVDNIGLWWSTRASGDAQIVILQVSCKKIQNLLDSTKKWILPKKIKQKVVLYGSRTRVRGKVVTL